MNEEVKKCLGKKKCKCGRSIIVKRSSEGKLSSVPIPVCGYCKTYGLEESKRLFVEENAMIKQKGKNTEFDVTVGKTHINHWKKKK